MARRRVQPGRWGSLCSTSDRNRGSIQPPAIGKKFWTTDSGKEGDPGFRARREEEGGDRFLFKMWVINSAVLSLLEPRSH